MGKIKVTMLVLEKLYKKTHYNLAFTILAINQIIHSL
jgi:hypothetical protein